MMWRSVDSGTAENVNVIDARVCVSRPEKNTFWKLNFVEIGATRACPISILICVNVIFLRRNFQMK